MSRLIYILSTMTSTRHGNSDPQNYIISILLFSFKEILIKRQISSGTFYSCNNVNGDTRIVSLADVLVKDGCVSFV